MSDGMTICEDCGCEISEEQTEICSECGCELCSNCLGAEMQCSGCEDWQPDECDDCGCELEDNDETFECPECLAQVGPCCWDQVSGMCKTCTWQNQKEDE